MKEHVLSFDDRAVHQAQFGAHNDHVAKRWIAKDGSGQGFVAYTLLLTVVSAVAATLYGLSVGLFNSILLTIVTAMP